MGGRQSEVRSASAGATSQSYAAARRTTGNGAPSVNNQPKPVAYACEEEEAEADSYNAVALSEIDLVSDSSESLE